jgi:hypothetical protein
MRTSTKRGTKAQTGPKVHRFNFNSIHELIKKMFEDEPTATGTKNAYMAAKNNARDTEWTGGIKGLTDYFDLLKNGYLPAVEELKNNQSGEGNHQLFTPSVCGEFSDVSAFLAGHPECMANFEEQPANNAIKININTCTPANMKGPELMEKCKTIFNCVNHLEANGKHVEIYISTAASNRKTQVKHETQIKIKATEEPILPAFHGLLLGHLSTTRVLIYSFLSLYSTVPTLGRVEEVNEPEMINISLMTDSNNQIKGKILTQGNGTL